MPCCAASWSRRRSSSATRSSLRASAISISVTAPVTSRWRRSTAAWSLPQACSSVASADARCSIASMPARAGAASASARCAAACSASITRCPCGRQRLGTVGAGLELAGLLHPALGV